MTTLVVGSTGATGKQLVEQLLNMGHNSDKSNYFHALCKTADT